MNGPVLRLDHGSSIVAAIQMADRESAPEYAKIIFAQFLLHRPFGFVSHLSIWRIVDAADCDRFCCKPVFV